MSCLLADHRLQFGLILRIDNLRDPEYSLVRHTVPFYGI